MSMQILGISALGSYPEYHLMSCHLIHYIDIVAHNNVQRLLEQQYNPGPNTVPAISVCP